MEKRVWRRGGGEEGVEKRGWRRGGRGEEGVEKRGWRRGGGEEGVEKRGGGEEGVWRRGGMKKVGPSQTMLNAQMFIQFLQFQPEDFPPHNQ